MKHTLLLSFCCILMLQAGAQESRFTNTYKFGSYTVKTTYKHAGIRISREGQTLFYDDSGDGAGYCFIDTMTLNADNQPDFIYVYAMEEYTLAGMLVSCPGKPFYKPFDITDIFDPRGYDTLVKTPKNASIKEVVLTDVNHDGQKDLLTNVMKKNGKLYPIKNWTDTFSHQQLLQIARGIPSPAKSRAVFLGK